MPRRPWLLLLLLLLWLLALGVAFHLQWLQQYQLHALRVLA
jgi:uncharacterized membrane protein